MGAGGDEVKRAFDFTASALGVIALSPILLMIVILIRVSMGSPVIFRQMRPGLRGRPFYLIKFRSMGNETDAQGNLLPDGARLTSVGRFLRSTSLDELPSLWNVLRGEMSLVGPRPLLMEYLPRYSANQMRRHDVRPGITGWAQVNGRNAVSWTRKFELDVWYVDNQTFLLDLKILLMTVLNVLKQDGISQPGRATADPFQGTGG